MYKAVWCVHSVQFGRNNNYSQSEY